MQPSIAITHKDLSEAISKSQKWKTPGADQVNNFWISQLKSTHPHLVKAFNDIMECPALTPEWLTEGVTFLIPKNENTEDAKNYRPITCLSTMYKLLTSVLTDKIYSFLEGNNMFPLEQKGCKRGTYGCKDQLLINKMINDDCHARKKNLSMAWIDYKKAFDSIPHSWIVECLETWIAFSILGRLSSYYLLSGQARLFINWTIRLLKSMIKSKT